MAYTIAAAEKTVLVEIVKLAQKRGMKGDKGSWKEFLDWHDRKLGASLSDPAKRSVAVLAAFLKTFTKKEDLKFFAKIMRCHLNRKTIRQVTMCPGLESPEQRLVRLTLQHPQYPLDYSFPSHEEEWMVIKLGKISKALKSNAMVAIDCEMVLCQDGTEAVVKVCVVDHNLEVKLNELVNPMKAVADYRTEITGVSADDLEGVTCSLADIQKSMKKLLSHGTILVGHSLYNDLQALKLDHSRVIDTSFIFNILGDPTYRRPSLNNLCKFVLGNAIRKKGEPHNCLKDAQAAMKLALAKLGNGFEDAIDLACEDVPETELAKLLLHRIPVDVPMEELKNIFPKDFIFELQPNSKVRGKNYSAFAIFKDLQEAREAFERIKGCEEMDSYGRPQKLISLQCTTGEIIDIYVRKMERIDNQHASKKRPLPVEENTDNSKKPKTDEKITEESTEPKVESNQCDHHVKEIERLKQELRHREDEIASLQKILSALTRKHGL